MNIQGKVFVVSGAGNGIGREVTLELLRRGATVAGLDINSDWLDETATRTGSDHERFHPFCLDITNKRTVKALAKKVPKIAGQVDGIVNVAGIIQPFVTVNHLEDDAIERVMAVNFFAPLNLIRAFLPDLLQRPQATITNVSSMGSYAPVPGQTVYGASKAALNLLSEGLRSELKDSNVAITVIYPGAIGTNIASNSGLEMATSQQDNPERTVVEASDAGQQIVDAIDKDRKRILIGSDATAMWWANRVSPDLAGSLIYQSMKDLLPPAK